MQGHRHCALDLLHHGTTMTIRSGATDKDSNNSPYELQLQALPTGCSTIDLHHLPPIRLAGFTLLTVSSPSMTTTFTSKATKQDSSSTPYKYSSSALPTGCPANVSRIQLPFDSIHSSNPLHRSCPLNPTSRYTPPYLAIRLN